uniref:Uncharacterized protein n=1 Tax=Rhizophora mucronata TaxID=61149 RepID=A0A2P2NMZ7_RHIMU
MIAEDTKHQLWTVIGKQSPNYKDKGPDAYSNKISVLFNSTCPG